MDKDEIVAYLKANLSIKVDERPNYYGSDRIVSITLMLGDDTICSDSFWVRDAAPDNSGSW